MRIRKEYLVIEVNELKLIIVLRMHRQFCGIKAIVIVNYKAKLNVTISVLVFNKGRFLCLTKMNNNDMIRVAFILS